MMMKADRHAIVRNEIEYSLDVGIVAHLKLRDYSINKLHTNVIKEI